MANELTNLAADIYKAADTVAREHVGYLPSVTINGDGSDSARAAVGGIVRSAFTRAAVAGDRNKGMSISEGTDQVIDNKVLTITKDRSVEIPWLGEEIKSVNNGAGFDTIYGDQITQAMRTLTNEMEVDLKNVAYQGASRAVGIAGTTPFHTNLSVLGDLERSFIDNGAPVNSNERSLILNSKAKAKMYGLTQLTNVNERGNVAFLEQGIMGNLNGFGLRVTGASTAVIKGTGTGFLTTAAFNIGDVAISVDSGSLTILAGDIITFDGDTNKYVVAIAHTGGTVTIARPGLLQSLANDVAITVGENYDANVSFERSAIELVVRAPAVPMVGGVARDAAVDRIVVVDPTSGIPFETALYLGQGKVILQVAAVWGVKSWKPENINILLG
jgi:hypothetical protein